MAYTQKNNPFKKNRPDKINILKQKIQQQRALQDLKDGKFKDSVYGDKDGDYGLAYNDLIAPLIKAVQELSAKV